MNDAEYRMVIARDWMEKAEASLKDAGILLREKSLVSCVNRLYYAAFYAVCAALAKEGQAYGRHTAVRAALHRDFVKLERVPLECGNTFNRLFDDRQEGDYTPKTAFDEQEIQALLQRTREFLDCFGKILAE
jgi:uncharacterized protein